MQYCCKFTALYIPVNIFLHAGLIQSIPTSYYNDQIALDLNS